MKHIPISVIIAVIISMIGCSNPISDSGSDVDRPNVGSTDFYITGKVTNNGAPVKGAAVKLTKSGLKAITKDDGSYIVSGTASATGLKKVSLAKTAVKLSDSVTTSFVDTLVISVPTNKPNDSSEVVKTPVTSGVIMDLPATYIVQREIRGSLTAEDKAIVGKIQAYVYDNSVPDQVKVIDLWHDEINDAFNSFAYFSSETNKTFTLYVKIYDNTGKFISQSPNFSFPDNAGNIIFKDPFSIINAKPILTVIAPTTVATNSKAKINVVAADSFGGKIVKCEIDLGKTGVYVPVQGTTVLNKKSAISGTSTSINDTIVINTPATEDTLSASIKVTDNDGNETIKDISVSVTTPKVSFSVMPTDISYQHYAIDPLGYDKADTSKIYFKATVVINDATIKVEKYEWRFADTTANSTWISTGTTTTYQTTINEIGKKMTGLTFEIRNTYNDENVVTKTRTVVPVQGRITLSNGMTIITTSELLFK